MRRLLPRLLLLLALLWALPLAAPSLLLPVALAQETATAPDYVDWERVASRAEGVLDDRRASDVALAELRAAIVDWRSRFLNAQAANETRLTTVRSQLTALGAVPANGTAEAPEIASRRAELSALLTQLEAPRRQADEAYSRADGIVGEIDAIVRERQTEKLSRLGPSPVNPANWPEARRSLTQTILAVGTELSTAWRSATQQAELRAGLPVTLFYLAVALVFLGRGRYWMERLTWRVQGREVSSARGVQGFLISLGQVLVPVIGILALVEALFSTKLFGFRGQIIVDGLPLIGVAFFGARWLSGRLFPKRDDRRSLFNLSSEKRRELRLYAALAGLAIGLNQLFARLTEFENYSEASRAIVAFPLLVVTGLMLLRAGLIILRRPAAMISTAAADSPPTGDEPSELRFRTTTLVARILVGVGVAGPAAAAIGYGAAAEFLVYPSVLSLALIGLLFVLQDLVRAAFVLITGSTEEAAQNALIPVLVGFVLLLTSLPFFGLIWGARTSDLTEIWARFREGIAVGETRISPTDFLTFAIVFVIGYALTRLLQNGLRTSVLPKTNMDAGGRTAIVSGVGYVGIFLAAVFAISSAGIDLSSLAIVAGALSVGIGFGLQNIVSNFVSGIILLIERPISEGDWIEVGGQMGYVRNISVRSTRIETFDRSDVIVPNADLISGTVTNYTRGNLIGRAIVPVGVAYGTDTQLVSGILLEIAEAHPMVTLNPPPVVHFIGFGADSMDFEIRAILRDVNFTLSVKTAMNHEIVRRFAEAGIEIPFAQRDVWLRNPEVLQAKPAPRTPAKPAKPKGTA